MNATGPVGVQETSGRPKQKESEISPCDKQQSDGKGSSLCVQACNCGVCSYIRYVEAWIKTYYTVSVVSSMQSSQPSLLCDLRWRQGSMHARFGGVLPKSRPTQWTTIGESLKKKTNGWRLCRAGSNGRDRAKPEPRRCPTAQTRNEEKGALPRDAEGICQQHADLPRTVYAKEMMTRFLAYHPLQRGFDGAFVLPAHQNQAAALPTQADC